MNQISDHEKLIAEKLNDDDSALKERLQKARAASAERDKERERREKKRELELLELEEKFETEIGPRGREWDMVNTSECPVAFRLGDSVLHKQFVNSKLKESDVHDFVYPSVIHPDRDKFLEVASRRPGLLVVVANKLADLYAAKSEDDAGKR